MANEKKVFSAPDAAPTVLYAKQDPSSQLAYPIVVDPNGAMRTVSGFTIPTYDTILLTYSTGNLTTVIYVSASVSVATLSLAYSGSTLTSVQKL